MGITRPLSIAVLGGGVAGLGTALALARDGHNVTLVERDGLELAEPLDSVDWERKGCAHFLQSHSFGPRGRKELRLIFPDVNEALLAAGAWDLDLRPKIKGGEPRADDEEFVFLRARRPLIEWALRRAVHAEPRVRVVGHARATGLVASHRRSDPQPRAAGVETDLGVLDADLVVDAMGRRTPAPEWVRTMGGEPMDERSTDCSIIYYSRYYRVRDGVTLPDGPGLPSPRGDLGYAAFATFPGDNGTFAALVAVPPGDQPLKAVRDLRAFEAATRAIPTLDAWTNADASEPIGPVRPMGSLQNTIRSLHGGRPSAIGLISVGDAICHTDPLMALGLAFSLMHARHLVKAIRDSGSDLYEAALAFDALARDEMEERYGYASAVDGFRLAVWSGEVVDFARADGGAYPYFTWAAGTAAALVDGDIFRAVVRRNMFLEPLAVLDQDAEMQRRIERTYAELVAAGRPRLGPSREELIEVMNSAVS